MSISGVLSGNRPAEVSNQQGDPTTQPPNPRNYPDFQLKDILSYTNNQIKFYVQNGVIPVDQMASFQEALKSRNDILALTNWDGNSEADDISGNEEVLTQPDNEPHGLSDDLDENVPYDWDEWNLHDEGEPDSDYP